MPSGILSRGSLSGLVLEKALCAVWVAGKAGGPEKRPVLGRALWAWEGGPVRW